MISVEEHDAIIKVLVPKVKWFALHPDVWKKIGFRKDWAALNSAFKVVEYEPGNKEDYVILEDVIERLERNYKNDKR